MNRIAFATALCTAATLALAGDPLFYSTGFETSEGFSAGATRTVGTVSFPQTMGPGPSNPAFDRTINQGVHGQAGWSVIGYNDRLDQEINVAGDGSRLGLNAGGVRSGSQSWRMSNWFHTGLVNPILSPTMAAAGESGSGNNGTVARSGSNNRMTVSFDFRSAADSFSATETYMDMSTSISDAPGNRMAFLGLGEWDGTGRLVAYSSSVTGAASTNDVDFGGSTLTDLQWGRWYNVSMSFEAVDGADNDVVTYTITDLVTNTIVNTYVGESWEEFYRAGTFGSTPGTIPGVDHVAFRSDYNADYGFGGTNPAPGNGNPQTPFDSYSSLNTPSGFYIDNFSITVAPTPGAAALLGLGGLAAARRRRAR